MTDQKELRLQRMFSPDCAPHEFDPALLQAEIERLTTRDPETGFSIAHTNAEAREIVRKCRAAIEAGPPQVVESAYARRAREQIEDEDAAREVDEPPATDLQAALEQRAKALERMDRAIDALATARAAEVEAVNVILGTVRGKESREWLHLGHVAAAVLARLGDCGFVDDLRWDKSAPSPRLSSLADCHDHIRNSTKKVA